MNFSHKNKWKFLSFALVGILTIGVITQPQAFAISDNDIRKRFDEVWAAINSLTATTEDLQEQINNIELTPGPQGEPGADGQDGEDGISCWDLDGDGIGDTGEDINGDGIFDARDCKGLKGDTGETGAAGTDGTNGQDGLNCWDVNGDGVKDESEDINGDGQWNTEDCQGPAGTGGGTFNTYTVFAIYFATQESGEATVQCDDAADQVTGGGFLFITPGAIVTASTPNENGNGWIVGYTNAQEGDRGQVIAVCADITP
jgi:hypothetical protein